MRWRQLVLLPLACTTAGPLLAQAGSDIYLLRLNRSGQQLSVAEPINISASPGYDNQPSFLPDGSGVLFTSVRGGATQSDIYQYSIAQKSLRRVTSTDESEYSPMATPGGMRFSSVRVERDSTQRLWSFALDGSGAALVLPDVRPVGYHAWMTDTSLVLFVLGQPNTLTWATTKSTQTRVLAENIGRSLHMIPGSGACSYVDKSESEWWITAMDLQANRKVRLVATPPRAEDYIWLDGSTLLISDGSRLLVSEGGWAQGGFSAWREVADLSALGITGATRLAVSRAGDWLAVVAADASPARN